MDEIEIPTEQLHETLQEKARGEGGHPHGGGENAIRWAGPAALSSALIAVLAAISALLAGHFANDAMIEQMRATDGWAYYQAKGVKAAILQTKIETLQALGKTVSPTEPERVKEYEHEQGKIREETSQEEKNSSAHLAKHNAFARIVTVLQVSIALAAIAVLSRKKMLFYGSLSLGVLGAVLFVIALL